MVEMDSTIKTEWMLGEYGPYMKLSQINEETHRIKGMYMTNVDFCVKIQCVTLYFVNYFHTIKNTFTLHICLNIIIYHQFTQEAIIIHFVSKMYCSHYICINGTKAWLTSCISAGDNRRHDEIRRWGDIRD